VTIIPWAKVSGVLAVLCVILGAMLAVQGVRVDAAVDAAARAGVREGDLILAVANTEVASVQSFEALVARLDKTKPVSLLIRRGNAADFVTIRPAP
jgi:serine protease Do